MENREQGTGNREQGMVNEDPKAYLAIQPPSTVRMVPWT